MNKHKANLCLKSLFLVTTYNADYTVVIVYPSLCLSLHPSTYDPYPMCMQLVS